MKMSKVLSKVLGLVMLSTFLSVAPAGGVFGQLPSKAENRADAENSDSAGLSTGLISLLPGQSIRAAAVNVGGKNINGQFVFVPVGDNGKAGVPILCNLIFTPGDAGSEKFAHPGGVNRMQLYVQIRVYQNSRDIGLLVPSAEIVNEETGLTEQLLSGFDFVSFRPIWVP